MKGLDAASIEGIFCRVGNVSNNGLDVACIDGLAWMLFAEGGSGGAGGQQLQRNAPGFVRVYPAMVRVFPR